MKFFKLVHNGHVYETFGISKHFPVKLQVLLIRAETLDNPLTAKCFIYDVTTRCVSCVTTGCEDKQMFFEMVT
jgi:hypothetical protein